MDLTEPKAPTPFTDMSHEELGIEKPKPRNVSNSEVIAFLSCKRSYDFAFIDEIAPYETPGHLSRGSVGHQFFEQFFRARMEGADYDLAFQHGLMAFVHPNEDTSPEMIMHAQHLCIRFMESHKEEITNYWKPLGVEETLHLPLTSSLNLTIRYDLYYEDLRTGKKKILDWKFTYDFWKLIFHNLNAQMPKYIGCMRANGYQVDEGEIYEIRTRSLGKEKASNPKNLWRKTPYRPSRFNMKNMLEQHVRTALLIEKHRALSPEARKAESIPVLNQYGACKFCNFQELCNSMNEGKTDLSVDIREGYKQSTYGYNKADPLEGL